MTELLGETMQREHSRVRVQQLSACLTLLEVTPLLVTLDLDARCAVASNDYELLSQKPPNKQGFLKHQGFLLVYRLA